VSKCGDTMLCTMLYEAAQSLLTHSSGVFSSIPLIQMGCKKSHSVFAAILSDLPGTTAPPDIFATSPPPTVSPESGLAFSGGQAPRNRDRRVWGAWEIITQVNKYPVTVPR